MKIIKVQASSIIRPYPLFLSLAHAIFGIMPRIESKAPPLSHNFLPIASLATGQHTLYPTSLSRLRSERVEKKEKRTIVERG